MSPNRHSTAKIDEDCRPLVSLLQVETRHYKRLLRLAWRQNSYMKRQDVDRLEANAAEWARYLPRANESRIARERFVQRLSLELGISIPPGTIRDLLTGIPENGLSTIEAMLNDLKATTTRLARQNELNRDLAKFCLDLAQEEAEIFKQCVLKDPAGCYSGSAETTNRGPGGVLVRQA